MSDATEHWVRAKVATAADTAPTPRAAALLGAATAARIRDWAARIATETACAARGAGVGWDEVYEALFYARPPEGMLSAGEAAFYYCTTGQVWPPTTTQGASRLMAMWTCQACLHRVADLGPWGGPDTESGHAGDCPRHASETTVWQLRPEPDGAVLDAQDELHARDAVSTVQL